VIFGIYAPKTRQKPLRQKPAKNLCDFRSKPATKTPNKNPTKNPN